MKRNFGPNLIFPLILLLSFISCSDPSDHGSITSNGPFTATELPVPGDHVNIAHEEFQEEVTSENEFSDLKCGSQTNEGLVTCPVESSDSTPQFIVSAEKVIEYSDSKCIEGETWKVSDDSLSITTSQGCVALFQIESIISNLVVQDEVIVDNDTHGNLSQEEARTAHLELLDQLERATVGDHIDIEWSRNSESDRMTFDDFIIYHKKQEAYKIVISFQKQKAPNVNVPMTKTRRAYLLNERGDIIKIVKYQQSSDKIVLAGIKEVSTIIFPTEVPISKITQYLKK